MVLDSQGQRRVGALRAFCSGFACFALFSLCLRQGREETAALLLLKYRCTIRNRMLTYAKHSSRVAQGNFASEGPSIFEVWILGFFVRSCFKPLSFILEELRLADF